MADDKKTVADLKAKLADAEQKLAQKDSEYETLRGITQQRFDRIGELEKLAAQQGALIDRQATELAALKAPALDGAADGVKAGI